MQKIEVLSTFRHDGQTYHAGEVRMVGEADAGYFCGLGWAKSDGHATGEPDTSPRTLEVQSRHHAARASTISTEG